MPENIIEMCVSYMAAQDAVGLLFKDKRAWVRKAILKVSQMGKFSSDRAIAEYAKNICKLNA